MFKASLDHVVMLRTARVKVKKSKGTVPRVSGIESATRTNTKK